MDAAGIERIAAIHDAQEAGRLFKGFIAKTWYRTQIGAALEHTFGIAVMHNALCHTGCQTGNTRQQRCRSGIHIDTNRIHAILHHGVQRTR